MPAIRASAIENGARWCAVVLGFSIPISTALDQLLCALLLVIWLAGGNYALKWQRLKANHVALAALALLLVIVIAVTWSMGPLDDRTSYLRKYANLLMLPMCAYFFADPSIRRRALVALAAALVVTLILSFAVSWNWISGGGIIKGTSEHPVFRSRITQNIFMSFGALLFVYLAQEARSNVVRTFWGLCAIGAVVNVLFITPGRIGYVVLPPLLTLVLFSYLRWKGLALALGMMALLLTGAFALSETFQRRVNEGVIEAVQWNPRVPATKSIEYRLEFYTRTVDIIAAQPVFGVGTGGFKRAYAEQVRGTAITATSNPHNLYLLLMVETGVLGPILLLVLFVIQWRRAAALSPPGYALLARGLVITIAVSGLFNSIIIDHAEAVFFAWMSGLLFADVPRRARKPVTPG